MDVLISETLTNASVLWSALSCVATWLGVLVVFFQLRHIGKSIAAQNVSALQLVAKELRMDDFVEASEVIRSTALNDSNTYEPSVNPYVHAVLSKLDFIARLISDDYLDHSLFFDTFGDDLDAIYHHIVNLRERQNSMVEKFVEVNHNGFVLLEEAHKYGQPGSVQFIEKNVRRFMSRRIV